MKNNIASEKNFYALMLDFSMDINLALDMRCFDKYSPNKYSHFKY